MTSTQTFILSLVVIIGGGLLVRFPPANVEPSVLIPFITGAIGTVLGYVFSGRSSQQTAAQITSTASQTASQITTAAGSATPGGTP